jgi:transposase-like protein
MVISSKELRNNDFDNSQSQTQRLAGTVSATRMRCPSCNLPAIAPMASTFLHECAVENDWVCSACGAQWSSRFSWLLV